MPKYQKKALTVDAVELQYPMTLTTSKGIQRANPGDYLVSTSGKEQFFIQKNIFELTYEQSSEPDTIAPMNIENLEVLEVAPDSVTFLYDTPYDSDFNYVTVLEGTTEIEKVFTKGSAEYKVTGLSPETTYDFLFVATDNAGNEASGVPVTVDTLPPTITP